MASEACSWSGTSFSRLQATCGWAPPPTAEIFSAPPPLQKSEANFLLLQVRDGSTVGRFPPVLLRWAHGGDARARTRPRGEQGAWPGGRQGHARGRAALLVRSRTRRTAASRSPVATACHSWPPSRCRWSSSRAATRASASWMPPWRSPYPQSPRARAPLPASCLARRAVGRCTAAPSAATRRGPWEGIAFSALGPSPTLATP
mmetsp:Transcript_1042/g.4067  ORF Transcript_1042/g.4067 Transcript_1042/m.4067 type:complete len:203 (-) Transcript_1042:494-1102(-)